MINEKKDINIDNLLDLLNRIRREWCTSVDPVIAYNCGEFEKDKESIIKHISDMNKLLKEAAFAIYWGKEAHVSLDVKQGEK